MVKDPGQTQDVATEQQEVATRLRKAVADWGREMLPLVGKDDRPYTVGYSKTTYLPARDGESTGGIVRSAKPPNSSFFTNWKNVNDRITWDIELAEAGNFTAEVYYTCPAADVGSTIELSFLNARRQTRIMRPNDPPLVGKAEDRVERGESYVKDFKPLKIGRMRLEKGRGKLTLRAIEVKAAQVSDIRYMVLTRI